jgi:hypothetical protein
LRVASCTRFGRPHPGIVSVTNRARLCVYYCRPLTLSGRHRPGARVRRIAERSSERTSISTIPRNTATGSFADRSAWILLDYSAIRSSGQGRWLRRRSPPVRVGECLLGQQSKKTGRSGIASAKARASIGLSKRRSLRMTLMNDEVISGVRSQLSESFDPPGRCRL